MLMESTHDSLFEKFGIPRVLLLGFLAVAIFTDGRWIRELTFLSKFMVDQGFSSSSQASLLVTMYGLFAALGGWCAACSPKCSVPAAS